MRRAVPPMLAILAAVAVADCSPRRPASEASPPSPASDGSRAAPEAEAGFREETMAIAAQADPIEEDEVVDDAAEEAVAPPCSRVPGVCRIAIQPLGNPPQEEVEVVARTMREFYGFDVVVLDSVDLPDSAYWAPRRRWRAERLLDFLRERLPEGSDRIAGVTHRDISTTKGDIEDWGILGLADLGGAAAVFSSYRCKRKVHDVPPLERLSRVAIHEVGHTLGLPHCPTYGCYLEDAGGKAETIDRETFLCDICRERLGGIH